MLRSLVERNCVTEWAINEWYRGVECSRSLMLRERRDCIGFTTCTVEKKESPCQWCVGGRSNDAYKRKTQVFAYGNDWSWHEISASRWKPSHWPHKTERKSHRSNPTERETEMLKGHGGKEVLRLYVNLSAKQQNPVTSSRERQKLRNLAQL